MDKLYALTENVRFDEGEGAFRRFSSSIGK
jgi:hypothetical protein